MSTTLKTNAEGKTISELLAYKKYKIDFYQREYKWETKHINELLNDLENKFLLNYDETHAPNQVAEYKHYFLGSIIVTAKDKDLYIVDGQQRLTTIMLLLIYLNNLQSKFDKDETVTLNHLIYSEKHRSMSFNIKGDEREKVFEILYKNKEEEKRKLEEDHMETTRNLLERYKDIEENFPESLKDRNVLPFFIDWLINCVEMVEINPYSNEDAYTIFETMNDRGLNLTAADRLKGYILRKIVKADKIRDANKIWKTQISKLLDLGKNENLNFFKVWLRAKYAVTSVKSRKDRELGDFENIGGHFDRWVRDYKDTKVGLKKSEDFYKFVEQFAFFSDIYVDLKKKAEIFTNGFEHLFYNNYNNFTLQFPLIIAAIRLSDKEKPDIINKKIKLVSRFAETFLILRGINHKTFRYNEIYQIIFNFIKKIRDKNIEELPQILKKELSNLEQKFNGFESCHLHERNKRFINFLLARITNYIELQTGIQSQFTSYVLKRPKVKVPFEIEHIIPNKFERYKDEFEDKIEFLIYRNRLGNLLLVLSGSNQSIGDNTFDIKVNAYLKENLLAKSLHKQCYNKNPNFVNYLKRSKLPFKGYEEFKSKKHITERQNLYKKIIEEIWDFNAFEEPTSSNI